MPDARVIPIGGGGDRPSRRAADAVAAGASRAGGERARRRRSPLIDDSAAQSAAGPAAAPGQGTPPGDSAAARAAGPAPGRPARSARTAARKAADPAAATASAAGDPVARAAAAADAADALDPGPGDDVVATAEPAGVVPEWERKLAALLAFARRRLTGDVQVDEFGFDPELTDKVLLALLRPLYERYFRVEARGLENVPSEGGALLVANHSGTIPLDSIMTQIALLDHHPGHRHLRMLGADLVFSTPIISELARKTGTTLACNADAERLLHRGELVGVWPEGFKGIGKPFSERYKLQRFGRGGFVSAALRAGAPIVPCSIVGAEEIYPIIGNMKTLARLLGLPYVPVTPTFPWLGPLGAIPLPSKWIIEFGEPIPTDGYGLGAADDPMLVFNLTDQVRETIQHTLYRLLMARRSIFF